MATKRSVNWRRLFGGILRHLVAVAAFWKRTYPL
jgi:hypothetical protein